MKTSVRKSIQIAARTSSVFLLFLNACAQSTSSNLNFAHKTDSTAHTTAQKMRQQCYAQLPQTRDVKDSKGVKICVAYADPSKRDSFTYKVSDRARKFTMSKIEDSGKKRAEKISLKASVEFVNKDMSLTPAQKTEMVSQIQKQCIPNLRTFWNKSDIVLAIDLQAEADKSNVDQVLALDFVPDKNSSTTQTSSAGNFELRIDEWGEGPKFNTNTTTECNDKASKAANVTEGEREQLRSDCLKLSNQPFCLGLNKLVGHWVGLEDKSDLRCYDEATAKAAADSQAKVDADQAKNKLDPNTSSTPTKPRVSFMSYPIDSLPLASDPKPALSTPVVDATGDSTQNVAAASPDSSKLVTTAAVVETSDSVQNAKLAELAFNADEAINTSDDLVAPIKKAAPVKTSDPSDEVVSQESDPSYESWTGLKISEQDVAQVFACDLSKKMKDAPAQTTNQNGNNRNQTQRVQPQTATKANTQVKK
jgi:hypothetical protein